MKSPWRFCKDSTLSGHQIAAGDSGSHSPRTSKDENGVLPWTSGDLGGLNAGTNPPRRCATTVAAVKTFQAFTPSQGGDSQERRAVRGCTRVLPALSKDNVWMRMYDKSSGYKCIHPIA